MLKRLLIESLVVFGGTLFFLLLCATVGISMSTPPTSPTAEAAHEPVFVDEDLGRDTVLDSGFEGPLSDFPSE